MTYTKNPQDRQEGVDGLGNPSPQSPQFTGMHEQTVIRTDGRNRSYTKISNALLQDPRLKDDTLGMLCRLLSRPANWRICVAGLIATSQSGKTKVYRMLGEAIALGYLIEDRGRNADGTLRKSSYIVTDEPQESVANQGVYPLPENREVDQKTISGQPDRENPDTENQPQQIKERTNNEKEQSYTVPASANDLSEKLIEAGGQGLANPASSPGLLVLSEPQRWLAAGCDLKLDILPTITARSANARPGSIRSWSFFTQAIADAKATRETPMPAGYAVAARPPHRMSHEDRQAAMRARLREADEREEREAKAKLEAMQWGM